MFFISEYPITALIRTFALMFRNILTLFILFSALSLASCRHKPAESNKMQLTVSIIPQKYLAEFIAGDKWNVQVMLPKGTNHETYEPAPRDMERIASSKLYLALGALDFEIAWLDRFKASNPSMRVINTGKGIVMLGGHHHGNDEGNKNPGHINTVDPHIWLCSSGMKIQALNICNAVSSVDTANSAFYKTNLSKFNLLADSVDRVIRTILTGSDGKYILIFHPALAYFARDYNLKQISIEQDGKEPSPALMAALIKTANDKGIKAIFISKEFDTRNAEAIAREIKAKVVVFDPMAENWPVNLIHLADLIASN